ncbi:MAG: hypothetical protein WA441_05250 [Methyloceanibacter sp.]
MINLEYEQLFARLQSLEETLKRAQDEMQTDRRGAAITALQGILDFVDAIPGFESQGLSRPITC